MPDAPADSTLDSAGAGADNRPVIPPDEADRIARVFRGEYVAFPDKYIVPPTTPPADRETMLYARALSASRNPAVRLLASGLRGRLAARLRREPAPLELVQAVTDDTHQLVVYRPDPAGVEVFNSVEWTLGSGGGGTTSSLTGAPMGAGDCEDFASAASALGISVGLDMRPKWWDQPGQVQNHVASLWSDAGRVISVETTVPGAIVGETPQQAVDRIGPLAVSRILGVAI